MADTAPHATPPSVLVVDDDPNMRVALEAGLAAHGFAVHAACDGATACRLAGELRPDLVVLDWVMPGDADGADTCRRLRDAHPAPVVMLTGLADDADRRAALDAGASAFLVKGIELEALVERLRELL